MNVINVVLLSTILCAVMTCTSLTGQSTVFTYSQDSWKNAFDQSVIEDKNVVVVFYTSWCKPSIWMDKFVFSQEEIKSTLLSRFITLKINIDEIEGFEQKNKMDVNILPTILILSSDQRVLERVETVLEKKPMLTLLQKYQQTTGLYYSYAKRINQSPSWKHEVGIGDQQISDSQTSIPVIPNTRKNDSRSHSLVLGTYTEYAETSAFLESIRNTTKWPVTVSHFFENQKVHFTIKLGIFEIEDDALKARDELENKFGIKSYVF